MQKPDYKNASPLLVDSAMIILSLLSTVCAVPMGIMVGLLFGHTGLVVAVFVGFFTFIICWAGAFGLFLYSLEKIMEK